VFFLLFNICVCQLSFLLIKRYHHHFQSTPSAAGQDTPAVPPPMASQLVDLIHPHIHSACIHAMLCIALYMHVIALEYFIGHSARTPANLRPMQRRYKPTTNELERRRLCLIRVVHRCRLTSRRLNRNSRHLLLRVFFVFALCSVSMCVLCVYYVFFVIGGQLRWLMPLLAACHCNNRCVLSLLSYLVNKLSLSCS